MVVRLRHLVVGLIRRLVVHSCCRLAVVHPILLIPRLVVRPFLRLAVVRLILLIPHLVVRPFLLLVGQILTGPPVNLDDLKRQIRLSVTMF